MDFIYSIVGFFATGGIFMYPILLVFAFGVAIAVERYITLSRVTSANQAAWEEIQPVLAEGDFEKIKEDDEGNDQIVYKFRPVKK